MSTETSTAPDRTDEPRDTTDVTVVGLGAMGTALAEAFLAAGHRVTVWNRSPARAERLVAKGASGAPSVAAAVSASPLTVVCLVDYAASRQVLEPVAAHLAGRTLVNLTSDTPERAREAATWAATHGVDYLDGAIMIPVPVVGTPGALLLYSGSETGWEAHEDTLRALGGDARYLGPDPGRAALFDLGLLDIFWSMMAGATHAFALVGADGVTAAEFAPLAVDSVLGLAPLLAELAGDVDAGQHPGEAANLVMELAAVDHITAAARTRGLDTSVLDAVRALMARTVAAGHGGDGFTRVIDAIRAPDTDAHPAP